MLCIGVMTLNNPLLLIFQAIISTQQYYIHNYITIDYRIVITIWLIVENDEVDVKKLYSILYYYKFM